MIELLYYLLTFYMGGAFVIGVGISTESEFYESPFVSQLHPVGQLLMIFIAALTWPFWIWEETLR